MTFSNYPPVWNLLVILISFFERGRKRYKSGRADRKKDRTDATKDRGSHWTDRAGSCKDQ